MSTDKIPNSRGGAPAAKKPAKASASIFSGHFGIRRKPAEPIRAPKAADKPKE